jgi:two-component system, NarL family, sensor kinase
MDENEGALQVTITDDGIGLSDSIRYGVGFNSMRERAEEIGGAIEFIAVEPCGTQIRVRLPLS